MPLLKHLVFFIFYCKSVFVFCCNLHFTPHAAFLELDLSLIIYHVVFRGMKHVIPKSFLEANPLAAPLGSYFGNYLKTLSKITNLNLTWI